MAQAPQTSSFLTGDQRAADLGNVARDPTGISPGDAEGTKRALAARMRDIAACWTVRSHDLLGSTNDEASGQARQGAPDRTVVWARAQTAGRGRQGRTWASPDGNLHVSVVLRDVGPTAPQLGFVAALAVADSVDAVCGTARARLKWPNDVLLDGAKLAGLLLEVEQTPHGVATILGVGMNVRHFPLDASYPATSLRAHGFEVSVDAMLAHVLTRLGSRLDQWRREGFDRVRSEWALRGHQRGDALRLNAPRGQAVSARFVGLDNDGSLLALVDGAVERFSAAEIVMPIDFWGEQANKKG